MVTLASLFDGIGGAPLCASICGAEPVWASEIEKFPIMVTDIRFPNMKQLGDITKIDGAEVEPVDIIVGGSPCQDLSVAGLRKGIRHSDFGDEEATRSGLFMEQIRIVKEMRSATNGSFPRFMVWENVPGAFSSNDGEDFRAVLEETARIADPTVWIPRPQDGWSNAGSVLADGFSISWRTFDAQYWGVPQRRRRIYLVADFRGQSAPKILFEQTCGNGYFTQSGSQRQGTARNAENGVGAASGVVSKGNGEAFLTYEKHMSLGCGGGQAGQGYPCVMTHHGVGSAGFNGYKSVTGSIQYGEETSPCLESNMPSNVICLNDQGGSIMDVSDKAATLRAEQHGHQPVVYESHPMDSMITDPVDVCPTVTNHFHKGSCDTPLVAQYYESHPQYSRVTGPYEVAGSVVQQYGTGGGNTPLVMAHGQANAEIIDNLCPTLNCNHEQPIVAQKTVRRLTPLECERLQGYPDNWTNILGASDSARYKALGNSFAIPNALFVIQGCVEEVERG